MSEKHRGVRKETEKLTRKVEEDKRARRLEIQGKTDIQRGRTHKLVNAGDGSKKLTMKN